MKNPLLAACCAALLSTTTHAGSVLYDIHARSLSFTAIALSTGEVFDAEMSYRNGGFDLVSASRSDESADFSAFYRLSDRTVYVPRIQVNGAERLAALRHAGGSRFELLEVATGGAGSILFMNRMAGLDRAFVPALLFSNKSAASAGAVGNAAAAMEVLGPVWDDLQLHYGNAAGDVMTDHVEGLAAQVSAAAAGLSAAQGELASADSADLMPMHDALEALRNGLATMRGAAGIEYFMDAATDYHHAMESLTAALSGVTGADELGSDTIATIEGLLPELTAAQARMAAAEINAEGYNLGSRKLASINTIVGQQGGNLSALSTALADGDNEATLTAAEKVKPMFVKMFLRLGDFITPFAERMATMEREYIPALFHTNSSAADADRVALAATHVGRFKEAWEGFSGRYGTSLAPLGWSDWFDTIDQAIVDAETVLGAAGGDSSDISAAHEAMEVVRETLLEWRGFESALIVNDYLTRFHTAMGPVASTAAAAGDDLDADGVATLVAAGPALADARDELMAALAEAGFDTDATDGHPYRLSMAVEAVLSATGGADDGELLSAAQGVKPAFVGLFRTFGAF